MIKVKDLLVSDDILAIVAEEVKGIKSMGDGREIGEIIKLERLAKIYSVLMSSARENTKSGIYGKLTTEELEQLDKELSNTDDSSEPDEDLD